MGFAGVGASDSRARHATSSVPLHHLARRSSRPGVLRRTVRAEKRGRRPTPGGIVDPLRDCCQQEADRNLKRHRAVAVCDGCGQLLLAYDNQTDFDRTVEELSELDVSFQTGARGKLLVISKER